MKSIIRLHREREAAIYLLCRYAAENAQVDEFLHATGYPPARRSRMLDLGMPPIANPSDLDDEDALYKLLAAFDGERFSSAMDGLFSVICALDPEVRDAHLAAARSSLLSLARDARSVEILELLLGETVAAHKRTGSA